MYYITMIDSFMSGWGHAKNLKNKLIFVTDDLDKAEFCYQKALARPEMKYVYFCNLGAPREYRPSWGKDYTWQDKYVQVKTEEDYPNWFSNDWRETIPAS